MLAVHVHLYMYMCIYIYIQNNIMYENIRPYNKKIFHIVIYIYIFEYMYIYTYIYIHTYGHLLRASRSSFQAATVLDENTTELEFEVKLLQGMVIIVSKPSKPLIQRKKIKIHLKRLWDFRVFSENQLNLGDPIFWNFPREVFFWFPRGIALPWGYFSPRNRADQLHGWILWAKTQHNCPFLAYPSRLSKVSDSGYCLLRAVSICRWEQIYRCIYIYILQIILFLGDFPCQVRLAEWRFVFSW